MHDDTWLYRSPLDMWSYVGMFAAITLGAVSFGFWHNSLCAAVWMLMVMVFLPVIIQCLVGLMVVIRQEGSRRDPAGHGNPD